MKTLLFLISLIPLLALSSCSTVQTATAKIKELRQIPGKPKIQITKPNPANFLPEGTSAEAILVKTAPSNQAKPSATKTQPQPQLLAKNTPAKAASSLPLPSPSLPAPAPAPAPVAAPAPAPAPSLPPITLPPLPTAGEGNNTEFRGILPSLNGSNGPSFIDIDGKALELPPVNYSEG